VSLDRFGAAYIFHVVTTCWSRFLESLLFFLLFFFFFGFSVMSFPLVFLVVYGLDVAVIVMTL
jgi:hypothetical protein